MKTQVVFNRETEQLIRDGYEAKHGRVLDESVDTLHYYAIPEYLRLGKKVRRRRARERFFDEWGGVLVWAVIILFGIGWATYSNTTKNATSTSSGSSYHSSTSGITYGDSCPITTCNDGACSSSTGRGTCSHHGGVRH